MSQPFVVVAEDVERRLSFPRRFANAVRRLRNGDFDVLPLSEPVPVQMQIQGQEVHLLMRSVSTDLLGAESISPGDLLQVVESDEYATEDDLVYA